MLHQPDATRDGHGAVQPRRPACCARTTRALLNEAHQIRRGCMRLTDEVLFDVVDGTIAVITIDRPEQRNAINQGVMAGLREAWHRLETDDALRVGILTASGDKA